MPPLKLQDDAFTATGLRGRYVKLRVQLPASASDLQLDKAVDWLQQELKKKPVKKPQRPPYPNYHNREITSGK